MSDNKKTENNSLARSASNFLRLLIQYLSPKTLSESLEEKFSKVMQQLQQQQFEEAEIDQLLENVVDEYSDPMLLWHLSKIINSNYLTAYGAPVLYLFTAPSVQVCLNDLHYVLGLIFRPSQQLEVQPGSELYTLKLWDEDDQEDSYGLKNEKLLLFCLVVLGEITEKKFCFETINIPKHRLNFNSDMAKTYTSAKITRHDGPLTAQFKASWLEHKNEYQHAQMREKFLAEVQTLLDDNKNEHTLTQKVGRLISEAEQPAAINLETIATQLHKGTSTLRRDLAQEKSAFKQIQHSVVAELAFQRLYESDDKIEVISMQLGYKDRSTFERFFRKFYHVTPVQMRKLGYKLQKSGAKTRLQSLIQALPPLPSSCQALILAEQQQRLDVSTAVSIIQADPLFSGRLIGLASKAVYGRKPKDLRDAIATNLGINTVKNFAVLFSSQDSLHDVVGVPIDSLVQAMMLTPQLYETLLSEPLTLDEKQVLDQTTMFAVLGVAIICHQKYAQYDQVSKLFNESTDMISFCRLAKKQFGLQVFSTSSALLASWGFSPPVLKQLLALDNANKKVFSPQRRLEILFAIAMMWSVIHNELEAKSILQALACDYSIQNFEESWLHAKTLCENY